jgi:hypothetical protein
LLDVDEIIETHLKLASQIIADPVLLAARKAIAWSQVDLQHLQHVLKSLRATGLSDEIEKLPEGAGWKAILRRISNDMGRARAPASRHPQVGAISKMLRVFGKLAARLETVSRRSVLAAKVTSSSLSQERRCIWLTLSQQCLPVSETSAQICGCSARLRPRVEDTTW